MGALRYLLRSLTIMNIALLGAVALLLLFVIWPLFHVKVHYVLPRGDAKAERQEAAFSEKSITPTPADYATIGENNLFHPERRIPPVRNAEKAAPRPELVLYGTVITEGAELAFIEDKKQPRTSAGRGRRQWVVKKGEVIGGFVLKDIKGDRILLSRGEETMLVHLTEADKQRVGVGSSQGSGTSSQAVSGGAPLPGGPTPAPAPSVTPVPRTEPPRPALLQSRGMRMLLPGTTPAPGQ